MKFLTRINRNYLILYVLILAVVTFAGYLLLHIIIKAGAKESLLTRKYLIEKQILNSGEMPNLYPVIEVRKDDDKTPAESGFREVTIRNELENEDEVYLEYSDKIKVNDTFYLIKLRQPAFENEDLILILAITMFTLLLAAFIISFFITKRMNKTVWTEFEYNLREIESFSLSMNRDISLLNSDTEEFERLNRVIYNLTEKIKSDFLVLKEFTENASHEIQTPISVALLNLEEILQQDIDEETFKKAAAAISALKKLSVLNQSLVLLTRIDNRQFTDDRPVSFKEIAKRKIEEFSVLFESLSLDVTIDAADDLVVNMNDKLAEIMFNNLFSNAVNHNINGGRILIFIVAGSLKICNTGKANMLTDETIFRRFTRGDQKTSGLGLAIVKEICDICHLDIHYYKDELHCFIINPKS